MAVHISNDPADVAAVRAAADAEADSLYPEAFERVRAGRYTTPDQIHALRHRRDRAARDLRAVADDATAAPAARVSAAVALTDVGDAGGAERAAGFLASPAHELQVEVLKRLNNGEGGAIDWSFPGCTEALLRLIGDADEQVALTAAALASLCQVPGASEPVIARLDSGRVTNRDVWVGALSGVADTPEAAARAARDLFREPPDRYWTRSLMYNLHFANNHRDSAVRAPGRAAAREFCLRYLPAERTEVLVGDFGLVAEPEDVPLLEDVVARTRSVNSQLHALAALARVDPGGAVDRALAHAARRPHYDTYLSIFLDHATEADADRVIPHVRPTRRDFTAGFDIHLDRVVQLLVRFGEAGRAELRRWTDRLGGNLRTRAEWGLHGITLRPVLDALTTAGALPGTADELMAKLRRTDAELDEGDPRLVAAAFDRVGRAVSFDGGNGPIERDRDRLRMFTAETTGGLFAPECLVVDTHGDAPDAPATVRFVHGGRAFRFETKAVSGYLDVAAVTEAAGAALEASGHPERFLELPPDVLGPILILTDPAKYRPVAARFHLPAGAAGP